MSRNVESRFFPGLDGCGELVFSHFAQNQFLLSSANLEVRRQFRRKLDDPVIEKRRAHFDGMRHAHAVALHQNVIGQVVFLIESQEACQSVAGFW